jgi:hypothetical protein
MHQGRIERYITLELSAVILHYAFAVVVPRAEDGFLDVASNDQDVFVIVEDLDVVMDLKSLESLLHHRPQIPHAFLFVFREMLAVWNGEVVIHMEKKALVLSPLLYVVDEGCFSGVFASDDE